MDIENTVAELWFKNGSMEPIVPPKVHLSLTIVATICYSLVFMFAYVQLWLILYLRHKLFSTQTVYFFLCCIFTSLRIVLFSIFYGNFKNMNLSKFPYWILMCLPSVFQYLIVLLITVFYYKTYTKSMGGSSTLTRHSRITIVAAVILQILLSFIPIWNPNCARPGNYKVLTYTHVISTDLIFLATISIFIHVYRQFPKFPNAILIQEAKQITRVRSTIIGSLCIIGTVTKFLYDMVTLLSCYRVVKMMHLLNTLQESDFVELTYNGWPFIIFGIVLFLWEIAPLLAVMVLFRVHFPTGFFKDRFSGISAKSNTISYSRSHSASMASNVATRSRFIAIPNYGSANPFIYSPNTSSRIPCYSNNDTTEPICDLPPSVHQSYETKRRPTRPNRGPYITNSCTIQNDTSRLIQGTSKSNTSIIPRIWRSSSQKLLSKSDSRDHINDTRVSSSRLPTANEE